VAEDTLAQFPRFRVSCTSTNDALNGTLMVASNMAPIIILRDTLATRVRSF